MRLKVFIAAVACFGGLSLPAFAADSFKINVILPMTGGGSFLGKGEQAGLDALKAIVNREGGIGGQQLELVYHDDQTSPQVAVQLANTVLAEKPAVLWGSTIVAMCSAMAPLLKNGPFDYCFSPGVHPPAGSYQFSTSVDTHDLIEALVRYFRLRGMTKIAFMTSSDASGQDAERGFNEVVKLPENASVNVVERQRFNTTDVSVSAQIERIRAAQPQAFIAWSTGAPIATIFKAVVQAGLNVPFATTNGNMTRAQMEQYKDFLPKELYIPTSVFPKHEGLFKLDPRVEAEQQKFWAASVGPGGARVFDPGITHLVWDPANMTIAALRKLGPKASAQQMRDYIAAQTDYAGIAGIYDFKAVPQRGLGLKNALVTRWDPAAQDFTAVSQPSGTPLQK